MDLTDPLFCFKIKIAFQIIFSGFLYFQKDSSLLIIVYLVYKICLFWLSLYHKQCVFSMEAHEKKYREKIKKLRKTIDKMVR